MTMDKKHELVSICGVRGFVDENGVAQLNAEDVARGWGFTQIAKSGNEVVRWERVNKYLKEFGFVPTCGDGSTQVSKDDFIPENMVYRLGFKASNEAAQVFQAKLADEILPTIRKTGSYTVNAIPNSIDEARVKRAEATWLNAKTRQANLIWKISSNSSNKLYKQAGEAIAMNMLAGRNVVELPDAEQRPNHELGYFCQFIGKPTQWASALGRKLKQAGINKTTDAGVYKVTLDKKNNQRDNFHWFDDFLLPKLAELFPNDYVATV